MALYMRFLFTILEGQVAWVRLCDRFLCGRICFGFSIFCGSPLLDLLPGGHGDDVSEGKDGNEVQDVSVPEEHGVEFVDAFP